ncbi:hypothetical protein [uncultured Serinicoccus sp.]|uniref:hypothetical protein n=1 Tax=uncultured Serinicoccus sp. TaxID=735514 RepID=UPI00260A4E1F|nr:hypothetical protein [uncultured Serinicoccus sp.]
MTDAPAPSTPLSAKSRNTFYGSTVGYGDHPFRAILWLLAIGATAFAVGYLAPDGAFSLIDPGEAEQQAQPVGPNPWILALETALPAAATATTAKWVPAAPWLHVVLTTLRTGSRLLTVPLPGRHYWSPAQAHLNIGKPIKCRDEGIMPGIRRRSMTRL